MTAVAQAQALEQFRDQVLPLVNAYVRQRFGSKLIVRGQDIPEDYDLAPDLAAAIAPLVQQWRNEKGIAVRVVFDCRLGAIQLCITLEEER